MVLDFSVEIGYLVQVPDVGFNDESLAAKLADFFGGFFGGLAITKEVNNEGWAPSRAKRRAISRPMPRPEPVTRRFCSVKEDMVYCALCPAFIDHDCSLPW